MDELETVNLNESRKKMIAEEFVVVIKLAVPVVIANCLSFLMNIVDQIFVGHLGVEELAASTLGILYFNMTWFFYSGFVDTLDTFASQAHGAGNPQAVWLWTKRAALLGTIFSIPNIVSLLYAERAAIVIFQQPPKIAKLVGEFCYYSIPGQWFLGMFRVLQKYQQAQTITKPSVYVAVIANIFNIIGNYAFIFLLKLGFYGAPLATSCSRLFQMVSMLFITFSIKPKLLKSHTYNLAEKIDFQDQSTSVCNMAAIWEFIKLGIPGGLMVSSEALGFELSTAVAGMFGTVALDAHGILLSICAFSFISFPLGIANAASIRIGNLLGKGDYDRAKLASMLVRCLGVAVMFMTGIIILTCNKILASFFVDNDEVIQFVGKMAPIAALFQIFDGYQGCCSGVFRGMGRQPTVVIANLIGYWLLGAPIAYVIVFIAKVGVPGLWWGMMIGLCFVSFFLHVSIARTDWSLQAARVLQRLGVDNGHVELPVLGKKVQKSANGNTWILIENDDDDLTSSSSELVHRHSNELYSTIDLDSDKE